MITRPKSLKEVAEQSASLSDQAVWTISPDGRSVHWPLIGEDVRIEDLLRPDTTVEG